MTKRRNRSNENEKARTIDAPRTDWRAIVAIAVVAITACIAGLGNAFTQDDLSILVESSRLRDLSGLKDILTLPYWPPPASPDLYRPVASLLLLFQNVVGAGDPAIFRLVSYALYAAASVGVFRVASRMCPRPFALGGASLFAAHPVHAEAIALAVAQNELAVALLATITVARYVDRRRSADGELRALDWGVIGACYALAALAKEQGLVLPAFLLLAEAILIRGTTFSMRARRLWKGYAVLATIGAAVVLARTAVLGGRVAASFTADALRGVGLGGRVLTMLQLVPEWFRLLSWPAHLRAEYSPRELVASTSFGAHEALGLVLLLAAVAAIWFGWRRVPALAFGLSWTAVALFPVSNVFVTTGILLAERTLFLPSVGFIVAIAGVAAYIADRPAFARQPMRRGVAIATGVLVLLGAARSALRQRVWANSETLTVASVADAPRSWRVQQAYGELLFDRGQPQDGIRAYREAIGLAPEPWRPRNRFAQRLRMIGDDAGALEQLQLSLANRPGLVETISQIPPTLIAMGRYQEALQLADSIVVAENAPPIMVLLARIADSALTVKAPPGSIRIGIPPR